MIISKLILGLTYLCQCRCVHCSAGQYPVSRRNEMSTAEVKQVIRSATHLGARTINLFGGEASLREDFFELVGFAARHAPEITVDTNGQQMTAEVAQRLRRLSLSRLFISLDGATAEAHDAFQRTPGSYDKVMRAMAACRGAGLDFHVSTCAVKGYAASGELQGIIEIARARGAGGVRIALPMCSGNWMEGDTVLLDAEETALVREIASDGFVRIVEEETGTFTHCKAVVGGSLYVSPYGDVQPCNFIPIAFGNVRREPFELIVDRMSRDELFNCDFHRGECPMRRADFTAELGTLLDPFKQLTEKPMPLVLNVGGKCVNRCAFCWVLDRDAQISLSDLRAQIDGRPRGTAEVAICGGEPLIHEEITSLLAYTAEQRLGNVVYSSARPVAADPELAERLVAAGLRIADVAIFHWDELALDDITECPGTRAAQIRGIETLLGAGVEVRVTLYDTDRTRLKHATAALRRLGVHMVLHGRFLRDADVAQTAACFASADSPSVKRRVLWSRSWVNGDGVSNVYDVLLVFPDCESADPTLQLPHGLLMLAAPLLEQGMRVKIVDQRITPRWRDEVSDAVLGGVLCVGITCFISKQVANALEVARFVRGIKGDLPIVWGGVHPSLMPQQTLESPFCDAVVRGEGEATFLEYLERLREMQDMDGVLGLSFKRMSGEIVHNHARPVLEMDGLPPVPYDLVDIEKYKLRGLLWALYTSRGCPFKCAFCAVSKVHSRRWRGQSAERIFREMERVVRHGQRQVNVCEDNFFVKLSRVKELANLLVERGLQVEWTASARITDILRMSPELLRLLHKAGLRHLHIGAESGSDRILAMLDKKIVAEDIATANLKLKEVGIVPELIFMMGFPTETDEERQLTLDLIERLKKDNPDVWFWRMNRYVPYPGTPLFDLACENGFQPPQDLEGWADMGWGSDEYSDLVDYQVGF